MSKAKVVKGSSVPKSMWVDSEKQSEPYNFVKLGYKNYQSYLASSLWAGIKRRVFARCSSCAACSKPATEIHHINYRMETMIGSDISGLAPLCHECHTKIEFDGDVKRDAKDKHATMQKMLAKWMLSQAKERKRKKKIKNKKNPKSWRNLKAKEHSDAQRWARIREAKGLRKPGDK